jgi:hypothetical protein
MVISKFSYVFTRRFTFKSRDSLFRFTLLYNYGGLRLTNQVNLVIILP